MDYRMQDIEDDNPMNDLISSADDGTITQVDHTQRLNKEKTQKGLLQPANTSFEKQPTLLNKVTVSGGLAGVQNEPKVQFYRFTKKQKTRMY